MKVSHLSALSFTLLLPSVAFAQTFSSLVGTVIGLINGLIPVVFALTLIVIIWGVIKAWIIDGGNPTSIEEGKKLALAGIIGLVVMVSVWGIVALLRSSVFGF